MSNETYQRTTSDGEITVTFSQDGAEMTKLNAEAAQLSMTRKQIGEVARFLVEGYAAILAPGDTPSKCKCGAQAVFRCGFCKATICGECKKIVATAVLCESCVAFLY